MVFVRQSSYQFWIAILLCLLLIKQKFFLFYSLCFDEILEYSHKLFSLFNSFLLDLQYQS